MINLNPLSFPKMLVLFSFLLFSNHGYGLENSYDQPIKYNARYITNPEQLIVDALLFRGWEVKDRQPGKVSGWLNDYKGYEILLDITYDQKNISFQPISANKLRCGRSKDKKCEMEERYYHKWRLYLRKTIALKIHTSAINELLEIPAIKKTWLDTLESGSMQEKTKFVRNIIDLELYDADALDVIEKTIKQVNHGHRLSKHEVQLYAFYCKALALTKNPKFKALLEAVRDKTGSLKLKKYVQGYIETNYAGY